MIKKINTILAAVLAGFFLSGCTLMYGIFGPSIPSDLKIDRVTSFSIQISWKENDNFEYLVSYLSSGTGQGKTDVRIGKAASFVIEGLESSTEYVIDVKSLYKDKASSETEAVTGKTLLSYPKNVSFTTNSKDSVIISWQPVTEASGYMIYYDTNEAFSNNTSVDCKNTTSFTLEGLQVSTDYYFAAASYNDEGTSDRSPAESYSTVVEDYALGYHEIISSENSLSLTGLANNRIYMVKMNPSPSLISASNTRSITNTAPAMVYGRSAYTDDVLNDAYTAAQAGELVSGIWDTGFIRYDKPEPQKFQKLHPLPSAEVQKKAESVKQGTSRAAALNDIRSFWIQNSAGNWVEKSAILTSIGDNCYVWTAADNYDAASSSSSDNKITAAQSKAAADKFDLMYLPLTGIFGNKYASQYEDCIVPKDKISILIYDIDGDYKPAQNGGIFGFFWAKDFYLGDAEGVIPGYGLKTNEDEMFYVDSHFFDSYPDGIYSTLAHEFQHMLNFVQKNLTYGVDPDIWYNEMLSMVCEDLLASFIGTTEDSGPQSRFYDFVASYYQSGVTDWLSGEDVLKSYAGAYAFGAFLTRNYGGAQFIKDIASSKSVDQSSINDALIKSASFSTETFASVFKAYGRALCYAEIPLSYAVPSFNVPSTSTVGSYTYSVLPINLDNYYYYTSSTKKYGLMKLEASSAGSVDLRPYGFSVHYWGKASGDITLNFSPSLSSAEKVYIIIE